MKKTIKKAACLFAMMLSFTGFAACDFSGSHSAVDEGVQLLFQNEETSSLGVSMQTDIPIAKEVGDKNYLTIKLANDVPLVGYIHYTNQNDTSKTHKEKFFIEAGAGTFSMFLDSIRIGAFGAFEKRIDRITLQNVEEKTGGSICVREIFISDRTYNNQEMLYLDNNMIKVGASLAAGGALCHLESLNRNVVEYIDDEGKVRIDEGIDPNDVTLISENVNLVNVHDLGREIQQSYYGGVGEENGYKPDDDVLYDGIGEGYLYNPVQAGSAGDNQTQIIDYHLTENELYVKSRPQDWFFNNTQTDSYMESIYTFDEGGALIVTNRFVNFAQFTGMDMVYVHGHEIPAVYTVHPLNHFYCETVDGVSTTLI